MVVADALRETHASRHGLASSRQAQFDARLARRHYRVAVSRSNIGFAVPFKVGRVKEIVSMDFYLAIAWQLASAL